MKKEIWMRFKGNKCTFISLMLIIILLIMALIGPYLNSWRYTDQVLPNANKPPSIEYWFGTDALGRDLFTRVWYGARISLMIGLATGFISAVIGAIYGSISGYAGGKIDGVMMKLVEIFYSIPFLLYVIFLSLLIEPGVKAIIAALSAVCWLGTARVVRGQVLKLREEEFVLAARLLGASRTRIIFRHIIPNVSGPLLVMTALIIPEAIFAEAFLSFLGLGASAPVASLGYLIKDGMQGIRSYPWQLFFPAAFVSLMMLGFHRVSDGLRDALDPKIYK
jgi:oligopeptide transport system permease protein